MPRLASSLSVVIVCCAVALPAANTTESWRVSSFGAVWSTCSHTVSSPVVSPVRVRSIVMLLPSSTAVCPATTVTLGSSSSTIPRAVRDACRSWSLAWTGLVSITVKVSLVSTIRSCSTWAWMTALVSPGAKVRVPVASTMSSPSRVSDSRTS